MPRKHDPLALILDAVAAAPDRIESIIIRELPAYAAQQRAAQRELDIAAVRAALSGQPDALRAALLALRSAQ